MSQKNLNSRVLTFKAGEDLSSKYNYLVMLSSGNVVLATADAVVIGSLENKPKSGEAAEVAIGDTVKIIAGDSVTKDDEIVSDANGKGIARTTEHNVFGIALETVSAGEVFECLVRPCYK